MNTNTQPNFIALFPAFIFLIVFALLNIVYNADSLIRDGSPIFAAFIALMVSIFTFQKNETFNERIDIFVQGSSQPIVVHMCYVFFLSTIFTTILEHTGSMASAVNVCLHIFPTWLILPGMFLGACFCSLIIGTSIGIIAAFMPIAMNLSNHLHLNPSIIASTIICGSVFGDNLSILSDTTIAVVKITGTTMSKKLLLNIQIILPAFIVTVALLTYQNSLIASHHYLYNISDISFIDLIKALPYTITFYLALTGLDIIFVMILGIIIAVGVGLLLNKFTILTAINFMFDGFYDSKDMVSLFILVVLLSGLSAIITHNGGIQYLINKIKYKVSNTRHAKFAILCFVVFVNAIIAINSIAIVISGPAVRQIAEECDLDLTETACILDITSSAMQGLLPYTPQLLLAASIAHVSVVSILPYLYYQFFLMISLFIFIFLKPKICSLKQ